MILLRIMRARGAGVQENNDGFFSIKVKKRREREPPLLHNFEHGRIPLSLSIQSKCVSFQFSRHRESPCLQNIFQEGKSKKMRISFLWPDVLYTTPLYQIEAPLDGKAKGIKIMLFSSSSHK